MLKYLTGAAALALVASAALADPGGGKGGGGGGGGDGGGNPHAEHGGGGGADKHATGKENGNSGEHGTRADDNPGKADHDFNKPAKAAQHETQHGREDRGSDRGERRNAYAAPREDFGNRGLRDRTTNWRWADSVPQRTRGLIAGCPPGLAKKNNGCLPPGLARSGAARAFYDSPNWWNFDDRWHDPADWNGGDYRYYDGYLVRSGASGIGSWLPLLGGALSPGNLWPSQYETTSISPYYQDYYGVGQPEGYRYYDNSLYRVDPQSNAITAITALLTGDRFQVGQRMPHGYDVYNVPTSYRDQYRDGPNADYRYSDGTIYRVDPTTQLVQAVIELLT